MARDPLEIVRSLLRRRELPDSIGDLCNLENFSWATVQCCQGFPLDNLHSWLENLPASELIILDANQVLGLVCRRLGDGLTTKEGITLYSQLCPHQSLLPLFSTLRGYLNCGLTSDSPHGQSDMPDAGPTPQRPVYNAPFTFFQFPFRITVPFPYSFQIPSMASECID